MEYTIPDSDFYKFIDDNKSEDVTKLRLRFHNKTANFDLQFAITQIECRKKCANKLPSFVANQSFLFPDVIASEQASNESVAHFHSILAKGYDKILDMTAGLGIDSMTIAKNAREVVSCELNENRASCLIHNKAAFKLDSLKVENVDSIEYLRNYDDKFDMIFVDPARRGEGNSRVYNFKDCQPDIISNIDLLLSKANSVMIKASPLLDISQTLKDIPYVKAIRAISVHGECKEILVEASANEPRITTDEILAESIDLNNDTSINNRFTYKIKLHNNEILCNRTNIQFANIEDITSGNYLYEPNSTMMKLAPWNELCRQFSSLKKLSDSTHIFVSKDYIPDFPGRKLIITDIPDKKKLKNLKGDRLNVVSRNYPLSAEELRKKLNLKEGSDEFLYAGKIKSTPVLILAKRI